MSDKDKHSNEGEPSLKKLVEEKEILEELLEEVDLEICAKEGKTPGKAKRYRIRVDAKYYVVHKKEITGREILILAEKNPPDKFILTLKTRGHGVRTIGLDDVVDLLAHHVERFMTIQREVQEGALK